MSMSKKEIEEILIEKDEFKLSSSTEYGRACIDIFMELQDKDTCKLFDSINAIIVKHQLNFTAKFMPAMINLENIGINKQPRKDIYIDYVVFKKGVERLANQLLDKLNCNVPISFFIEKKLAYNGSEYYKQALEDQCRHHNIFKSAVEIEDVKFKDSKFKYEGKLQQIERHQIAKDIKLLGKILQRFNFPTDLLEDSENSSTFTV